MAPFDLSALGTLGNALTFGAIGFGFGAVLELGGFGDTRKLAGQFYLRDMTVLKVMFTGIVVAAVLVAGATGFGLLDMSRVWVNPTYLWPGIVGGLIMGVGFILGGFCPGTSVVAASTLKIDGALFLLGALGGVWLFGETVSSFEPFFLSSNMGRFTLPEWLGLPTGVTLMLVVLMALAMFWAAELSEAVFRDGTPWAEVPLMPRSRGKVAAATALVAAAMVVGARGQPTPVEKFALLGEAAAKPVAERAVFVHPAEVVTLRKDLNLHVNILDLRDEHDFNLFHVGGARRVEASALTTPEVLKALLAEPASTVTPGGGRVTFADRTASPTAGTSKAAERAPRARPRTGARDPDGGLRRVGALALDSDARGGDRGSGLQPSRRRSRPLARITARRATPRGVCVRLDPRAARHVGAARVAVRAASGRANDGAPESARLSHADAAEDVSSAMARGAREHRADAPSGDRSPRLDRVDAEGMDLRRRRRGRRALRLSRATPFAHRGARVVSGVSARIVAPRDDAHRGDVLPPRVVADASSGARRGGARRRCGRVERGARARRRARVVVGRRNGEAGADRRRGGNPRASHSLGQGAGSCLAGVHSVARCRGSARGVGLFARGAARGRGARRGCGRCFIGLRATRSIERGATRSIVATPHGKASSH